MDSRALKKIEDIRIRAAKINKSLEGIAYSAFITNEDKISALERNMEVIGEAAKEAFKLDPNLKNGAFATNANEIVLGVNGRNTIAHDYNSVDHEDLFETAKKIAPQLEKQTTAIINKALGKTKQPQKHKATSRTLRLKKPASKNGQENER